MSDLVYIKPIQIKKKCLCCNKEMIFNHFEDRDFCNNCFMIIAKELFNERNNNISIKSLREKIKKQIQA